MLDSQLVHLAFVMIIDQTIFVVALEQDLDFLHSFEPLQEVGLELGEGIKVLAVCFGDFGEHGAELGADFLVEPDLLFVELGDDGGELIHAKGIFLV